MANPETFSPMLLSLVSGLIAGFLGAVAAIYAYVHGYIKIEQTLLRQRRTDTARDLISLRYCLLPEHDNSPEDVSAFNRTICVIPFDFSDNNSIMKSYDVFINDSRNTDKLLALIRSILEHGKIGKDISETHLKRAITIHKK